MPLTSFSFLYHKFYENIRLNPRVNNFSYVLPWVSSSKLNRNLVLRAILILYQIFKNHLGDFYIGIPTVKLNFKVGFLYDIFLSNISRWCGPVLSRHAHTQAPTEAERALAYSAQKRASSSTSCVLGTAPSVPQMPVRSSSDSATAL